MHCGEVQSGTTTPLASKDDEEGSRLVNHVASSSKLRTRKYNAIKKGHGLDPMTPGIIMGSGDMTRGLESQGYQVANEASREGENFLSEVSKELEAKAARKAPFSSHS